MKTNHKESIKEIVSYIQAIQKMEIGPLETKVESLLGEMFPKIPKDQLGDWMLDVIYNDPNGALNKLGKIYV